MSDHSSLHFDSVTGVAINLGGLGGGVGAGSGQRSVSSRGSSNERVAARLGSHRNLA